MKLLLLGLFTGFAILNSAPAIQAEIYRGSAVMSETPSEYSEIIRAPFRAARELARLHQQGERNASVQIGKWVFSQNLHDGFVYGVINEPDNQSICIYYGFASGYNVYYRQYRPDGTWLPMRLFVGGGASGDAHYFATGSDVPEPHADFVVEDLDRLAKIHFGYER